MDKERVKSAIDTAVGKAKEAASRVVASEKIETESKVDRRPNRATGRSLLKGFR